MADLQAKPAPAPAPVPALVDSKPLDPPLAGAPLPHDDPDPKLALPPPQSHALTLVQKAPEPAKNQDEPPKKQDEPTKKQGGSIDRDIALAGVEKEKKLSYIKAWEESEKTKAENKAQKKLSDVAAWENSKKAAIEAKLKKFEEELERKKAQYGEKMKNQIALVHKEAEEKRAMVEAKRGEEVLNAEEFAAKYRATGTTPKKLLGCF